MTKDELKTHLTTGSTWLRGFFMLLFTIIYSITIIVIGAMVVFQFGHTLFTGKPKQELFELGENLSTYIAQILLYLTYNSDEKPFPFKEWASTQQDYVTRLPSQDD